MKKVTVLSELRSEFSGLTGRMQSLVAAVTKKWPKVIFCSMVVLMLCSLLLCFTMLRKAHQAVPEKTEVIRKLEGNLGEIGATAEKFQRVMEIRSALEVLLAKDSLDKKDSLAMERLLGEIDNPVRTKKK